MAFPLAGIRAVEFAGILAGPWAGQTLADLGADVIKAEPPRGDDTRKWGPPFMPERAGGDAAYFHCCNRGKRSAIVDLKSAGGREAARRLVARADVMLENFRPGAAARNGLDWDSVSELNPRLIVCAVSGFGRNGPLASAPGYDLVIQAASGLMDITGDPMGGPQKVGVAFADIFTGLYAVSAIQAALWSREKTGRGQFIDMALLDSQVGVLANQAMNFLSSGESPMRMGNAHPNIAPYESFPAADGVVVIAAGNDSQYEKLRAALALPERPDFQTNALRVTHRAALADFGTDPRVADGAAGEVGCGGGSVRSGEHGWRGADLPAGRESENGLGVPAGGRRKGRREGRGERRSDSRGSDADNIFGFGVGCAPPVAAAGRASRRGDARDWNGGLCAFLTEIRKRGESIAGVRDETGGTSAANIGNHNPAQDFVLANARDQFLAQPSH